MAIHFAHTEIISAASDSSVNGLSAYISRTVRKDDFTGARFNFTHKASDLIHREVMLPRGAPQRFMDAGTLWNAATQQEVTLDRVTRRLRFKKGAQPAKHTVGALPKELTAAEQLELTRRFVKENFTKHGVAVEFAIHRPDADSPDNYHVHILQSTRLVNANGFGRKARNLNPAFATSKKGKRFVSEPDAISDRWADAQNRYFDERGLDLRVDPKRAVQTVHHGPSWHAPNNERRQRGAEADAAAMALMQDPRSILKAITKQRATFTLRDLQKFVSKHGLKGAERDQAVTAALGHDQVVVLRDPNTAQPTERYTTKEVRAQELRVLEYARTISLTTHALAAETVAVAAKRFTLDLEQSEALQSVTGGPGLSVMIGRAGTGKTRVLSAVRASYEAAGFSVRGLAPTNTAAMALKDDGFVSSSTLHRAMYRLRQGSERWDRRTVLVVDEAAMADTEIYEQLLKAAADAGAKLILAGDDRQHSSVSRGGIFPELTKHFGAVELRRVRRQKFEWQREASECFSRGDTASGLKAYADRGFLHWTPTIDESRARLVRDWSADRDQDRVKFIYASTNVEVDRINVLAQAVRRQRGEIRSGQSFETVRGRVELSRADRIQFYGNDRQAGIFNGVIGTVQALDLRRVEVVTDAGTVVVFDPAKFSQWGLGYCGSVYRGQGKTQLRVFAFYDNAYAWNAKSAYVGLTRHKAEVRLYCSRDLATDEPTLARQMSRVSEQSASIRFEVRIDQNSAVSDTRKELAELRRRMGLADQPDTHSRQSTGLATFDGPRKRIASAKTRKLEPAPRRPR